MMCVERVRGGRSGPDQHWRGGCSVLASQRRSLWTRPTAWGTVRRRRGGSMPSGYAGRLVRT